MASHRAPSFFVCLKDIILHDNEGGQGSILKQVASSAILCPLLLLLYFACRSRYPQIYIPRTYLIPEDKRVLDRDTSFIKRVRTLFIIPDDEIAVKCGLDAYFFLRYVRSMLIAFTILSVVVLPVLIPVAYVHDSFEGRDMLYNTSISSAERRRELECRVVHVNSIRGPVGIDYKSIYDAKTSPKPSISTFSRSASWSSSSGQFEKDISFNTSNPVYQKKATETNDEKSDDVPVLNIYHPSNIVQYTKSSNQVPSFKVSNLFKDCSITRNRNSSNPSLVPNNIVDQENFLDNFNFSHVPRNHPSRYWAYFVMSLIVISLISWVILWEIRAYVKYRTAWLLSARHRAKPAAATVLLINVPTQDLTFGNFKEMVEVEPNSIQNIWVNPDTGKLDKLERHKRELVLKLERAEFDLLKKVHKAQWEKQLKDDIEQPSSINRYQYSTVNRVGGSTIHTQKTMSMVVPNCPYHQHHQEFQADMLHNSSKSLSKIIQLWSSQTRQTSDSAVADTVHPSTLYIGLWRDWIEKKKRPRLGLKIRMLPRCLVRPIKSIDKIDHLRQHLRKLDKEISGERHKSLNCLPCIFVRYHRREHAKMAAQRTYKSPIKAGWFEPVPQEILWRNLRSTSYIFLTLKTCTIWIVLLLLITTWAIPVWIIRMITLILDKLESLDNRAHPENSMKRSVSIKYLSWIAAPLPPALISVLMLNLPNFIFRPLARWQGALTKSNAEIVTQRMTFAFAFFQVFLVNLLSAGVVAWFGRAFHAPISIDNPAKMLLGPSVWARLQNISTSLSGTSRWCMAYLTYQALVSSTATFVQSSHLIWRSWAAWEKQTPRQIARLRFHMPQQRWAPSYAMATVMTCMVLTYCVAQPLVLVFGMVSFGMLLLSYKYNILYVWATRGESNGRHYPWALKHTFVGLYTLNIYMTILFFSQIGCNNRFVCIPQGICMMFVLLFLILFQIKLQRKYARDIKWGTSGSLDGRDSEKYARGKEGAHDFLKNGEEIVAWIPGGLLGVPEDECRAAPEGVQMTCEGAFMNGDGKVIVTNPLAGRADLCCKRT